MQATVVGAADVEVSVTVTSTGPRRGRETVQVDVADQQSTVFRPAQELKGFTGVELEPGESAQVRVRLDARAFSWWHTPRGRWVVEGGDFELRVGASSRDVRGTVTVELPGDGDIVALTPGVPVGQWLDHAVAGPRLRALLEDGPYALLLSDDDELGMMLRSFPISRLCRFPGSPLTEQELPALEHGES